MTAVTGHRQDRPVRRGQTALDQRIDEAAGMRGHGRRRRRRGGAIDLRLIGPVVRELDQPAGGAEAEPEREARIGRRQVVGAGQ